MAEIRFECYYCGNIWIRNYNSINPDERCAKCGDMNLRAQKLEDVRVDYYKGDKPFEEDKEKTKDLDVDYYFGDGFRGD